MTTGARTISSGNGGGKIAVVAEWAWIGDGSDSAREMATAAMWR